MKHKIHGWSEFVVMYCDIMSSAKYFSLIYLFFLNGSIPPARVKGHECKHFWLMATEESNLACKTGFLPQHIAA